MFTRKKAQRWVLILLVCVLFVGLLPVSAAAETQVGFDSYNGVELPPIKSEWKTTYDYMLIVTGTSLFGNTYDLYMTNNVEQRYQHADGLGVRFVGYSVVSYYPNADDWSVVRDWGNSNIVFITEPLSDDLIWSGFDLLGSAGVVFPATDPESSLGAYTPPVIIVNLPRNHVYTYEVNEVPQQLYVDASLSLSNNSDTGIHYQWLYYAGTNWAPVDYGDGNSKYYTPNTGVEGTRQYCCRISNAEDIGGVSSVLSNSVYVVVGSAVDITEPVTPADQIIIDQVGQIGDKIDELPGDIADGVGEQIDQAIQNEQENAEQTGNDAVNNLIELIPDVSKAGQAAMSALVEACSYNGYDAVLPIPALVMPAIGDIIPEYTLLPAQELDLGAMFELVPFEILLIVQILITIALVFYMIKDTYDTIQYFLTLREGSNNE